MCSNTYGGDVVQASHVHCGTAHRIVRTWAHRFKRDGRVTRTVLSFRCRDRSDFAGGAEGLVVRCRRGSSRSVMWYANVP
jgi:hypothetical protein